MNFQERIEYTSSRSKVRCFKDPNSGNNWLRILMIRGSKRLIIDNDMELCSHEFSE